MSFIFHGDCLEILPTIPDAVVDLMLTGPTGYGKTSLIEQLAARIGFGCIKVPCHGELEFEDLIGTDAE